MPWPIAVPCEVDKVVRARSSLAVSVVGGTRTPAVPANATRPMRGPPASDLTKALAAFSAAVMRFGCTSVEHIEPETSRASMIVPDDDGTRTVACGRAAPTPSTASPSSSSAAGMSRRQRLRPGRAARTSAIEVTRTASRRRRRRVHHQAAITSGTARRASNAHGQDSDIQITRPDRTTVRTEPAASSTRARAMNAPASGSRWRVTVSLSLIAPAIRSSSLASETA